MFTIEAITSFSGDSGMCKHMVSYHSISNSTDLLIPIGITRAYARCVPVVC